MPQPSVDPRNLPRLPDPRTFNGKCSSKALNNYLYDVQQHFEVNPTRYATEKLKIIFAAAYLTESACVWFQTLDQSPTGPPWYTYEEFQAQLEANYADFDPTEYWLNQKDNVRQKTSVSAYISEFNTIVCHLDMTDQSKMHEFKKGLKEDILQLLFLQPSPKTFDELATQTNEIDSRIYAQKRLLNPNNNSKTNNIAKGKQANKPKQQPAAAPASEVEPMQIDNTQCRGPLTDAEKKHRRDNNLCLYCGEPGHISATCPNKKSKN